MAVTVYAYNIEPPLARLWHAPQVLPRHQRHFSSLVIIDRCLWGLDIARGPRFNLHKTEHIAVPPDQVNFATAARRAVVSGDDNVPQAP